MSLFDGQKALPRATGGKSREGWIFGQSVSRARHSIWDRVRYGDCVVVGRDAVEGSDFRRSGGSVAFAAVFPLARALPPFLRYNLSMVRRSSMSVVVSESVVYGL
jgi:hypothetical protein